VIRNLSADYLAGDFFVYFGCYYSGCYFWVFRRSAGRFGLPAVCLFAGGVDRAVG
jgi:hypothetical protein